MPFDGIDAHPALNRTRLIHALRAQLPKNFRWEFGEFELRNDVGCGTAGCAMGLAKFIGIVGDADVETVCAAIGIPPRAGYRIFWPGHMDEETFGPYGAEHDYDSVTPQMVADALEALTV